MRSVLAFIMLLQVSEPASVALDELLQIRASRVEDPANGRLAFAEGEAALNAGQLADAMSAFQDATELLDGSDELARAYHALAVAQHNAALAQAEQNPQAAKDIITSAIANYAQALEYEPDFDPARRNGERAAQFVPNIPPPPPESSEQEGDQEGPPEPSEESEGNSDDSNSPSEESESPEESSGDQTNDPTNQDESSTEQPSGEEASGSSSAISEQEARQMLQEIRDRAEERQEELNARNSRRRVVERDW
ncbi:MAG: hypothetical protein CMJ28_03725 [Phycisphaerae bacterium]|nr:hypothetical protein [Phycisphaerae bacterium]